MSALDQFLLKTYRESVTVCAPRSDPMRTDEPADEAPRSERAPEPVLVDEITVETAMVSHDAEEIEPRSAPVDFKPDWEVDQFRWPQVCQQLTAQLGAGLDEAIQQLQQQCEARRNVLMITSSRRQVGRTTLTLCLARRAAQRGLRVAVVDLDHENPCLMSLLGVAADVGVESLCQGTETAESICITALEDGVSLLPIVKSTTEAPWTWRDLSSALRVVAAHHDLVFLDAPPVENFQDFVASHDPAFGLGAIIVRDMRDSTLREMQVLASRLRAGSVWTAGVVDNFAA